MIESELHQENLLRDIRHWAKYTKASFMLRQGDVESLVSQILDEFYHVKLACGHLVMDIGDGVSIAFKDHNGEGDEVEVQGTYCRECADKYKKELGAWEIRISDSAVCPLCGKDSLNSQVHPECANKEQYLADMGGIK